MNSKTTLLFDFDGTIANTLRHLLTISNRLAEVYGYKKIAEEEITLFRQKTTRQMIRDARIPLLRIPHIAARVKKALQQEMHLVEPYLHMDEVLHTLSHSFRLGIITSNSAENVQQFLQQHQLPAFAFIHSDSSLFGKARILKKVLKRYGLQPSEVMYVGDETRDVEAAQKANVGMIAVGWGMNTADALARLQPDYLVQQPLDILRIVNHM